jgi:hypothetical protein
MNERIKELAEQAKIEIERGDYDEVSRCTAYGESLGKFAELIIRECARIAFDEAAQAGRMNKHGKCLFGTLIGKRIEKHFRLIDEPITMTSEAGVNLPHMSNTDNPVDFPKPDGGSRMNERIKEQLEQVGGYGTKALIHPDDVEKCANLLIAECISILPEDCPSADGKHVGWVIRDHFSE